MLRCLKDRKWVRNSVPKSEIEIWTSGLPVDSPLLGFGTVKNSPGFV